MPPARVTSGCTISTPPSVTSRSKSASVVSSSPPAIGVSTFAASSAYLPYSSGGKGSSIQNGRCSSMRRTRSIACRALGPAEADVDHQVEIVATRLARRRDERDVEIAIAAERSPAELDGVEAGAALRDDGRVRLVRRVRHQRARIGLHLRRAAPRRAGRGSACPTALPTMSHSAISMPLIACIDNAAPAEVDRAHRTSSARAGRCRAGPRRRGATRRPEAILCDGRRLDHRLGDERETNRSRPARRCPRRCGRAR